MKNYIAEGRSITVTATKDVYSSNPYIVGSMFGIASTTVLTGQSFELSVVGIYELVKDKSEFHAGDPVYFDRSEKDPLVSAKKKDTSVSIGVASQDSRQDYSVVRVRLNGIPV